jgi:hypothetical protein
MVASQAEVQKDRPEGALAAAVIDSLAELPAAIGVGGLA